MSAAEYFLIENRQLGVSGFDRGLPAGGLLVYHVDETIMDNEDEWHPKVSLLQVGV